MWGAVSGTTEIATTTSETARLGGLRGILEGLAGRRLLVAGGLGAGLIGLLAALWLRAGEPPMALLFGDLDQRDAGAVVASLERQRIPYRLQAGGGQILAPLDQIPRLRLALAREGLPAGGGVGWEIFDRGQSLTETPFQQNVNQLRALEGELARTIRGLAGVKAARVHLVLPRREAFSRERGEAQASVVLNMQGAQRLDREGVQAVLHLVATAVPGLRPQNISIVDSRGELLARGGQALAGPAAAATQEEMRRGQELRLARAVEELLERSLGPGRVRAEANVELDFDRVETRDERFDPENQVPRSTQSSTEQSRGSEPPPVSVAGNLPGADAPASGGTTSENRQEETTNYEIGRSTRNTLREHPVVKRLSLAVLVDGVAEPGEGAAAPKWRERTPEELQRIATLARSAIGFNEQRGDQVQVVSMRFVEEQLPVPVAERFFGLPVAPVLATRLIESALLALVALVAILLLGRPLVRRLVASLTPNVRLVPVSAAAAGGSLTGGGTGPDGEVPGEGAGLGSFAHIEGQMKASSVAALESLVGSHPQESLSVLRRWMHREEGAQA